MSKLAHLPLPLRLAHVVVVVIAGSSAAGCSSVECETLCRKTLECEVAFAPGDDPEEEKILTGERSEIDSCTQGCEESPVVTVEAADCIDGVDVTADVEVCQPPILRCLGLDEAVNGGAT